MKARVTSFQSIESAEITVQGFTAITGPSNIGKSALLRAISGALFGMEGDHFVRRGHNSCAVTVDLGDHSVEWSKVKRKTVSEESCLIIDGKKHTRIGKTHGDLTEPLGFKTLKAGAGQVRPQVARQHDPVFLLFDTPNTAAEVFKTLGRVDVITQAQATSKADLRKVTGERALRDQDTEAAQQQASDLGWVPALEDSLGELIEDVRRAEAETSRLELLVEALTRIEEIETIPEVPEIPELSDPASKIALLEQISRFQDLAPIRIPKIPRVSGAGPQRTLLSQVEELERAEEEARESFYQLATLTLELKEVTDRKGVLEDCLGVCPLCEREFE